ncbi:hypothetical protein AALG83_08915 [Christensenellaceae bacterium 44-20]
MWLLTSWPTASGAWGERHSMSEYAPSDRLTSSAACGDCTLHIPIIRV